MVDQPKLIDLSEDMKQLKTEFNLSSESVRVLIIVSPT